MFKFKGYVKKKYLLEELHCMGHELDEQDYIIESLEIRACLNSQTANAYKLLAEKTIDQLDAAEQQIIFLKKEIIALDKIANSRLETAMNDFDKSLKPKRVAKKASIPIKKSPGKPVAKASK